LQKLMSIEPVYASPDLINIDIRPVGEEALIDGKAIVLEVVNIELFGVAFEKPCGRPAAGETVKDDQFVLPKPFYYILKALVQEGKKAPFVADIGYELGIEIGET